MKCFYHIDMDGKCAAAIVYREYKDIKCIPINYNINFPFDIIEKDEEIIIVDYSLQKENEFKKLLDITKNVIWIDHHKTAIEKHNECTNIRGIRSIEKSGCELTWDFFHPDNETPKIVQLLGDYDTWSFKFEETKFVQEGIQLYPNNPESYLWNYWFINQHEDINHLIENGKVALLSKINYYKQYVSNWSYYTEFEGYKCIVCNIGLGSSKVFDSIEKNYDIMIVFIFDGNLFTISLYTEKNIDVSLIAKKYKGGGHYKAAGFQCKELPFKRI